MTSRMVVGSRVRDLQGTRRSAPYTKTLARCWNLLRDFSRARGLCDPVNFGSASVSSVNNILQQFIQHLYSTGDGHDIARHAVLSVQFVHRGLKGKLRPAWDSIESWQGERNVSLRQPLPMVVLGAICACARLWGMQAFMTGNKV